MQKRKSKPCLRFFVCVMIILLLLCTLVSLLVPILRPKRLSHGAMWDSYLSEEENTINVLFFGSSLAYCDIIPSVIYKNTNASSYVVASPVQIMPLSYYYIREALKTQSAKVVFLEVSELYFDSIDAYLQVGIDYMPLGDNKIKSIFLNEAKGIRKHLVFPIGLYHSEIKNITKENIKKSEVDMLAGYTYLSTSTDNQAANRVVLDYGNESDCEKIERNYGYLDKIIDYCLDRQITLVCFASPSGDCLNEEKTEKLEEFLSCRGIAFLDYSHGELLDGLGLEKNDWFDSSHLNVNGAKKFSCALSENIGSLDLELSCPESEIHLWEQRKEYFDSNCQICE